MGKPQINLVVNEEQRREWKDYAEDNGFSSLSDLIRKSVVREMAREGPYDPNAGVEADLGGLPGAIDRIEDTLTDVNTRLEKLEASSSPADDLPLHLEVQKHVPKLPSETAARSWIANQMGDDGNLKSEVITSDDKGRAVASITRLASLLGRREPEVRQAAYRLEKSSDGSYQTLDENGEVFIFEFGVNHV